MVLLRGIIAKTIAKTIYTAIAKKNLGYLMVWFFNLLQVLGPNATATFFKDRTVEGMGISIPVTA